jgi:hypothetical protein
MATFKWWWSWNSNSATSQTVSLTGCPGVCVGAASEDIKFARIKRLLPGIVSSLSCLLITSASAMSSRDEAKELAVFAATHKSCQLWTNWHQMCSRTGPHGAPVCATDQARPVPPSSPFCVSGTNTDSGQPAAAGLTPAQLRSIDRFCASRTDPRDRHGGVGCQFSRDRPFNGFRLQARRHPWCSAWGDAATGITLCREDSRGASSCAALAKAHQSEPHQLYCQELRLPAWCTRASGIGRGPIPTTKSDDPIIPIGENDLSFAVRGIYCRSNHS